ncbi:MAG TPA: hypothetical protein VHC97_20065 [Thermoanaerobaculia bacterium]|jgi:hypothetical protein|nr:hypothetical protein [Thermoanaerobaculia bacterium]
MKIPLRPPWISTFLAALMFLAASAPARSQASPEALEVQLDDTGVTTKFVNPLDPVQLQAGSDGRVQPLRFSNSTGDRTFVVTMPFAYSPLELASAYAVADEERGQKVVHEIVCAALEHNQGVACTEGEKQAMDTREGLRVLFAAVSIAKDTSLAHQCGSVLKGSDCIVETLFWRTACRRDNRPELLRFARQNPLPQDGLGEAVKTEATELVNELLGESAAADCTFERIKDLQERVDEELTVVPDLRPFIDPIAADAKSEGLKARFAADRVRLAKMALQEAIQKKMQEIDPKITSVLDHLEERRADLQKKESPWNADVYLQCQLHELEAAAKLLNSYSLSSKVPYLGVPESLFNEKKMCPKIDNKEMARSMRKERAIEQGVEITDCKSDDASTTCVATATIPPYQYATFSPSILAHHPKPRIAFTVAFFGETEVPANANGYVIRPEASAADKKPEKSFSLSLGGDTSSSLDPNKDVKGQLRHTGGSGTLSFLYTGAVEASATLKFKEGDFGGPADSNKIVASQYQGKIFGHKIKRFHDQAVNFQYGRLQFAKPSSGIAVNVFGEGLQLALGSASLAYVVLRESDNLKEMADTQNDDSSLWILQVKNVPISQRVFRTLDFIALHGEDRKDQEKTSVDDPGTTPLPIPFRYTSLGSELRWGFPAFGGSLAAYYSQRDVDAPPLNPDPVRPLRLDGQGWTVLARASWNPPVFPKLNELEKGKPRQAYGISLLLGFGTGDDKKTADEDEGYLGENAGFSNDVLFLSRVSKAFPQEIGSGLANKWYGGLQLTDAQAEWLAAIPGALGVGPEDIASTGMVLSLHTYQFVREVHGLNWGGVEADGELNVEAPKNIRWSLGGAYYHRSSALKAIGLDHDLWSVTAKLSIGLSYP